MIDLKTSRLAWVILMVLIVVSCGPSQREKAVQTINNAKKIVVSGDTLKAITTLDSVSILYPKAEAQISIAKNLKENLYQQLIDNRKMMLIHNDSTIIVLEKSFKKEKTQFDQHTQYIHKRQTLNRSWDRSFIQVHLDERGELFLSSNYMGKEWLQHTAIKVYDGKKEARTVEVPLDDKANHRSDFLDYKWEKISYTNGRADSVIQFIVENPDLNFKCVFLGNKYYWILLEEYDIQAIIDAYHLSKAIKLRSKLEMEIKNFKDQIQNHK